MSSANSSLIDRSDVDMGFNPNDLILDFRPSPDTYVIAARVSGSATTAYPEGRPEEDLSSEADPDGDSEEENEEAGLDADVPHLTDSEGPINVIVVADTDILDDRFWINIQDFLGQRMLIPTADNGTFVVNAVENLMGSSDLISLRSRGRDFRPLTAIENLRRQANARFLERENRLQQELAATEQKLTELQSQSVEAEPGAELSTTIISEEEEQELERFTQRYVEIRKELRAVQRDLRGDIEDLQNVVRFANIGLMPIIIGVFALVLALSRRNNRRKARKRGA